MKGSALPRNAALWAFAFAGFVLAWRALSAPWFCDDALIVFRTVDNLFAGLGLVFNPGERVEVFTSPLFVALVASARALFPDPFAVATAIGVGATVAEIATFGWLCKRLEVPLVPAIAGAALFATDRIVVTWTTGGLETALAGALTFGTFAVLAAHRDAPEKVVRAASVLALLAALTRPEAILFYPLVLFWLAWSAPRAARRGVVIASLNLVVPALAVVLAARFLYYGELVPNTFRAKMEGGPADGFGLGYTRAFAARLGFGSWWMAVWIAFLAIAWRALSEDTTPRGAELRRTIGLAFAFVFVQVGAVIAMGGDYMVDFRFYRPVIGILHAATVFGLVAVARARFFPVPPERAVVVAAALVVGAHLARQREASPVFSDAPASDLHKDFLAVSRGRAERFRAALLAFAEPGDKQLADKSGFMGYGHTIATYDATGLVSRDVAADFYPRGDFVEDGRRERFPGHLRWPKVSYLEREKFAFIFPKVNDLPPTVAEIREGVSRRTREYPFLHVSIPLAEGEFFRFFTTLTREQIAARVAARQMSACVRPPMGEMQCLDARKRD